MITLLNPEKLPMTADTLKHLLPSPANDTTSDLAIGSVLQLAALLYECLREPPAQTSEFIKSIAA